MNEQPYSPYERDSDNRLMAAAAHFFGLWVALIVWATQKDKSRFVRFQAVQAMSFDLVMMLVSSVFIGCLAAVVMTVAIVGAGGMVVAVESNDLNAPMPFMALMSSSWMLMMCGGFGYAGLLWVVRLIASIKTLQGQDFRYPWLGAQVEKFLNNA